MWILCLVLLVRIRSRRDQSILLAASTIALSMTLNLDGPYLVFDSLIGGTNVALLIADAFLVVGVYFLARAILVGVSPAQAAAMTRPYGAALILTLIAMVACFAFIRRGPTTEGFMQEYGSQAAASGYSAIQYLFIGAVMVLTSWNCLNAFRKMPARVNRVAFFVLGIGALLGVALSGLVLVFDWFNVFEPAEQLGRRLGFLYNALFVGAIVLMAAGLALLPIGRRFAEAVRNRRARELRATLQPLWERSAAADFVAHASGRVSDVEKLRRTFIETQDALLRSPGLAAELGPREQEALNLADQFFVRG